MGEDVGVFIRFQDTDVALVIRGCKEVLEGVDGNCNALITGVMRDNKYGGFRVYFNEDSVIDSVLKLKYLPLSEERATIHSITTKLTVHDVIPHSENDFKEELENYLESVDLKPIIEVCSIPDSKFPAIRSGNLLLELDIPEIGDLAVFRNNGLPYNMKFSLSFKDLSFKIVKKEARVSFSCCLCSSIEHSRDDCQELINNLPSHENGSTEPLPKVYIPKHRQRFEIREISPSVTKSDTRIGIEPIVGDLQEQGNVSFRKPLSFSEVKVKKELEDENTYFKPNPRVAFKQALTKSFIDCNTDRNSKKIRLPEKDAGFGGSPAASSTTKVYIPKHQQRFEIRERSPSKTTTAKPIRNESIVGNLQEQRNGSFTKLLSFWEIKKEDKNTYFKPNPEAALELTSIKREIDYDTGSSKQIRLPVINENPQNARFNGSPAASSTTGRDSSDIVYRSPKISSPTESKFPKVLSFPYNKEHNYQDDSKALDINLPTSSKPDMNLNWNYNEFERKKTSNILDSRKTIRTPKSTQKKKHVYAQIVIPKKIKKIINSKQKKAGELTIRELEVFFSHAKRKLSLATVAEQFTEDVQCLKDQLKWIVQKYYMTPKTGSSEDTRFISWLEGMLKRFNSVSHRQKKQKTEPKN